MRAKLWKDDPAYPTNKNFLSRSLDLRPGISNKYLEANTTGNGLVVKGNTIVPIKSGNEWIGYDFTSDTEETALDTGVLTLGNNYYLYMCDDGTDTGLLLISLNATAPNGFTTANSRKIGGFHFGRKRNSLTVNDVTSNIINPNYVWDLCHRPRCSPEGMFYLGNAAWGDIYPVSVDEAITLEAGSGSRLVTGTAKSAYNAVPLTGTEGLSGYNFIELAMRSGKRLMILLEWLQTAHGSPQGNNADNVNAWSATTNTARANTGSVVNAISLLGAVDCVGNVWEWLDEFMTRGDQTGWSWYDVMPGMNVGQLYMYGQNSLVQVIAGGSWSNGVYAGSRCVNLNDWPWDVGTGIGARFACDSL